ncbi:hypothetical protein PAEPH01_0156 [Pancytospora epiphaga]|nr:hypothetical protein PAEPH01_0156 [Pancytospora epiphaga]
MEEIREYDPENGLWKMICVDKKVTNSQIQSIDVCAVLGNAIQKNIGLKEGTVVLTASARVNVRRMRLLLEDCNRVFLLISKERRATASSFKIPSDKPITLGFDNVNLYIDDEMVDFDTEMLIPRDEFSMLENDGAVDDIAGIEPDLGDFSNVEQVRESTVMADSTIIPREESLINRKRRVLEDRIVEYDCDDYKKELRSTSGIVNKIKKLDIREKLRSVILLDPKIVSHLRQEKTRDEEEIEMQRLSSFACDNYEGVDFNEGFSGSQIHAGSEMGDTATEGENTHLFEMSNLPSCFEFGSLVEGYTQSERAGCFSRLLQLLSSSSATSVQEKPFGPILCELA